MAGIIEGIRVVEMGHVAAIPAAATMLADWGAEVIKVEPLWGEILRGMGKIRGVDRVLKFDGGEMNWEFQVLNRNKKALSLDLKQEPGRDILYKVVQRSDVFISNYELSALKKLRLDYATLSQLNPKLIYGVLTGYGTAGPDKDERGFDYSAAWARSGMQYMIGEIGSPPPMPRPGMMDRVVSVHVVAGILAALLHREKTGKGQEIEFSLYHSAVWCMTADIQAALMGLVLPKDDRAKAPSPLFNTYRSKDDRWFLLVMLQPDPSWPYFCRAIERPELENDPRFNSIEARAQNCEELIRFLDEYFASKNWEELDKRFRENNLIYGPIQTPVEVTTDPQAVANGFFTEMDHPAVGKMKTVTTPIKFRQNPASVRTPAPEVGQHTEEILLDLGYSWGDITQLKEQRAIP